MANPSAVSSSRLHIVWLVGHLLRLLLIIAALVAARWAAPQLLGGIPIPPVGIPLIEPLLSNEMIVLLGQRIWRPALIITLAGIALAGLILPTPAWIVGWRSRSAPMRPFPSVNSLFLGAAGLLSGAFLFLLVQLGHRRYSWYYGWIEILAVAGALAAAYLYDRRRNLSLRIQFDRWDLLVVVLIGVAYGAAVIQDLTNYYYSVIGDEYVFYWSSQRVAEGVEMANPFWQAGVYGVHPVAGTMIQSLVMLFFGIDGFGWKMSSVLIIIASFPPFYGFLKQAFNRWTAIAGLSLAACAHVILAYGHTGENNIQPILPAAMAVAFYLLGLTRGSVFYSMLAGLAGALGFYTFFSGRLMIFLLLGHAVLAAILNRQRLWTVLTPLLAGFSVLFLPFLAFNKQEIITQMFAQSVIDAPSAPRLTGAAFAASVAISTTKGFLAFLSNPNAKGLFISGSLLDLTTAVFALAGLVILVKAIRQPAALLTLGWIVGSVVITQGFSQAQELSVTRAQFAIPPAAAIAGLALERAGSMIGRLPLGRVARVVAPLAIAGVVALALWNNYNRFYVETPKLLGAGDPALVLRAVTDPVCESEGLIAPTVVDGSRTGFATYLIETYPLGDRQPWMLAYQEVDPRTVMRHRSCLVVMEPNSANGRALIERVTAADAGLRVVELFDPSGTRIIKVIHNPNAERLPPDSTLARLSPKRPLIVWKAGDHGNGPQQLFQPRGIGAGPDVTIYVADAKNQRVQTLNPDGRFIRQIAPASGNLDRLMEPVDVAVGSSGLMVVADSIGRKVDLFDSRGSRIMTIGGTEVFNAPRGVSIDREDNIYVADVGKARILKFDLSGRQIGEFKLPDASPGLGPTGVEVSEDGRIFISSRKNHSLSILTSSGELLNQWTTPGEEFDIGAYLAKIGDAVLVASPGRQWILVFDENAQPIGQYNRLYGRPFSRPIGLAKCGNDLICLSDVGDHAIYALNLYQRK